MDRDMREAAPVYPYVELAERKDVHVSPLPPPASTQTLLGPENTVTMCTFCHASIKTSVKYTNNTRTHIAAAICGLFCCCCCIPYCSASAKNSDHYCPNCERYLGTYKK